jgi:hypothetical protein
VGTFVSTMSDVGMRHAVFFNNLIIQHRHSIDIPPSTASLVKEIRYCVIAIVLGVAQFSRFEVCWPSARSTEDSRRAASLVFHGSWSFHRHGIRVAAFLGLPFLGVRFATTIRAPTSGPVKTTCAFSAKLCSFCYCLSYGHLSAKLRGS